MKERDENKMKGKISKLLSIVLIILIVYIISNLNNNQESTEIGNLILRNLSNLGIYNRGVKTRLCQDEG